MWVTPCFDRFDIGLKSNIVVLKQDYGVELWTVSARKNNGETASVLPARHHHST